MRWFVRRVEARDQRSSLSAFWALPARILKSRNASHEFADVAAMTLAIASGGRSKALGQVSASAVVTMATASSTGRDSKTECSSARPWIGCWKWLGRRLSCEVMNLIGDRHDLCSVAIDVFTMASPFQGVVRRFQELDVIGKVVHAVL